MFVSRPDLGREMEAHDLCMCLSVFEKGGKDENLHRTGVNRDRRGTQFEFAFIVVFENQILK
jgi:hypothetical protein